MLKRLWLQRGSYLWLSITALLAGKRKSNFQFSYLYDSMILAHTLVKLHSP